MLASWCWCVWVRHPIHPYVPPARALGVRLVHRPLRNLYPVIVAGLAKAAEAQGHGARS